MATCKNPKCHKTLVGREKVFCKSCKDKFKDNTAKGVKIAAGAVGAAATAAVGVVKLAKTTKGAQIIGFVVKKIPFKMF